LGAAVAREVLRVYSDEKVIEQVPAKASRIQQFVTEVSHLPGVVKPRALGMMGAVQLGHSGDYLEPRGKRIAELAKSAGVYLRPLGNVVYVAPALNIPDPDLDRLLAVVAECIETVSRSAGD
jgi:adenosylmethionine-8-amino-7-oxononanoate aminotransferase